MTRELKKYNDKLFYISLCQADWEVLLKEGLCYQATEFCKHTVGNYTAYLIGCKLRREAISLAIWAASWVTAFKNTGEVTTINLEFRL